MEDEEEDSTFPVQKNLYDSIFFFFNTMALVSAYQAEILVEMGCQQSPRPQRQTGGQQANQQPCCVSSKPWWKHSFELIRILY